MPMLDEKLRRFDQLGGLLLPEQIPTPRSLPIIRLVGCQDAASNWTMTNGTAEVDATDYIQTPWYGGAQSIRFTPSSGQVLTAAYMLPATVDVRSGIGIVVKMDDLAKLDYGDIYLYEETGKGYRFRFYERVGTATPWPPLVANPPNPYWIVAGQWAVVWIPRNYSVSTGSPTPWVSTYYDGQWQEGTPSYNTSDATYPVAKVSIVLTSASGQTPVVHLGGVVFQNFPTAGITISFDDGYTNAYSTAYPLLKSRGLKFAVNMATNRLNTTGNLTSAQIDEMVASGLFHIHSHSHTHPLDIWQTTPGETYGDWLITVAEWIQEWEVSQQCIIAHGWPGHRFFVTPGNRCSAVDAPNNNIVPYLSRYYDGGRVCAFRSPEMHLGPVGPWGQYSSLWIDDPYNWNGIGGGGVVAIVANLIRCAVEDRCTFELCAHGVGTGYDYTENDYNTILETILGCVRSGAAEVLWRDDWWDRTVGQMRRELPGARLRLQT
jgi:peptidoglycan/xylan/chitin deacetylase (PgdA/CDA1 family)